MHFIENFTSWIYCKKNKLVTFYQILMNMQVNFCWLSSANTFGQEKKFLINWSQMCHGIPLLLETFGGKLQHISIAAATGYAPDGPAKIVRFLSTRTWMYPGAPLCGFATQCSVFLDKRHIGLFHIPPKLWYLPMHNCTYQLAVQLCLT